MKTIRLVRLGEQRFVTLTRKEAFDAVWERLRIIDETDDFAGGTDWLKDELDFLKDELERAEKAHD